MKKTWTNCWLEYPVIRELPEQTVTVASEMGGTVVNSAWQELKSGLEHLYHCKVRMAVSRDADICLLQDETLPEEGFRIRAVCLGGEKSEVCRRTSGADGEPHADGEPRAAGGKQPETACGQITEPVRKTCTIWAGGENGILYGVFALLRQLQMEQCTPGELNWETKAIPDNPIRMMVHWDNLPGDIERGYSGNSLFFDRNEILVNERTIDYARLAASVGFNSVVINNTNVKDAAVELLTERYYAPLRRLMEVFGRYGIRMFLSVDYTMPMLMKELDTADPASPAFQEWWKKKADEVWENLPGLGGFSVKADSEGRPGPFAYGKNHADGANVLADALAPHGGILIWRCFVYNCQQDWWDTSIDRAKAGYDYYAPLDGCFRDNVVLVIKNGPMDFQVREPVSPLIGALEKTQMLLEVQIAQEYTGQQRHVCYLLPWFRQILDQDMCCWDGPSTVTDLIRGTRYRCWKEGYSGMKTESECPDARPVKALSNRPQEPQPGETQEALSGRTQEPLPGRMKEPQPGETQEALTGRIRKPLGGISAIANTGDDPNWTGHDLAAANFYGIGRLAFDTSLSPEEIAQEWVCQTFGSNQKLSDTLTDILLRSWPAYEKYNAPLGIGWMCNPGIHYGPCPTGYEYSRWGTYHKANHEAIGVDRTAAGTGFTRQYAPALCSRYENIETCPEELLLFFHRMPYSHRLKSGKTILQHIYDTHFEGALEAEEFLEKIEEIKEELPPDVYERMILRFRHQKEHAGEWRDVINTFFFRLTGIPDDKGRNIWP